MNSLTNYRSGIYRPFIIILLFSVLTLISCKEANETNNPVEEVTTQVDSSKLIPPIDQNKNKDRDVWQKPSIVVDLLGDLSDKTVADIGAGTGYFTFRLALKAQKVIAIEIESRFLDIIEYFKANLPSDVQERIETRLAEFDDPLLQPEEADLVVIINTIGEIKGRRAYLKTLMPGLKKGGKVVILDYKMKNLPIEDAPPKEDRVPLDVIEKELAEAGYVDIISNDTSLNYQYIVFATKSPE